jgi:hypothetical protein
MLGAPGGEEFRMGKELGIIWRRKKMRCGITGFQHAATKVTNNIGNPAILVTEFSYQEK